LKRTKRKRRINPQISQITQIRRQKTKSKKQKAEGRKQEAGRRTQEENKDPRPKA
jgi:hypothetical protein